MLEERCSSRSLITVIMWIFVEAGAKGTYLLYHCNYVLSRRMRTYESGCLCLFAYGAELFEMCPVGCRAVLCGGVSV